MAPKSTPRTRPARAARSTRSRAYFEALESRQLLSVTIDNLNSLFGSTITLPAGKSVIVPITASSTVAGQVTYTVTSSSGNLVPVVNTLNPAVASSRTFVKFATSAGDIIVQLFNDIAPVTVQRFLANLNSPDYVNSIFHRIFKNDAGADLSIVQGGDRDGDGVDNNTGLALEQELDYRALYTGHGQLAEARTGAPDSGGSQFFFTVANQRFLDLRYSIFGQVVRGFDHLQALNSVAVDSNGRPTGTAPTLNSVTVYQDTTDAVLTLVSTSGTPLSGTITVTARDASGATASKVFNFATAADTVNDPPFSPNPNTVLRAIPRNATTNVTIGNTIDLEGSTPVVTASFITNPSHFAGTPVGNWQSINITPDADYAGPLQFQLTATDPLTNQSTSHYYTVLVDSGAAPSASSAGIADFTVGQSAVTRTFTVTFNDDALLDMSAIIGNNALVSVRGPGGFLQNATFVSIDNFLKGAGSRTVTYSFTAPGGSWDAADAGSYTVQLNAGKLKDSLGNTAAAAALKSFFVSPNAFFDERYYLAQNADIAALVNNGTFASGYQHFTLYGQKEKRLATPYFNENYYLALNPAVAQAVTAGSFASGWQHWMLYGAKEGRGTTPVFSEAQYLQLYPDLASAKSSGAISSGFEHFMLYGQFEGRNPSYYFDLNAYKAAYPDVVTATANGTAGLARTPLDHFILGGQKEGRVSNAFFNENYYRAQNPDVAAAITAGTFKSGFEHYILFGAAERRKAVTTFDTNFYLAKYPDVANGVAQGWFKSGYEHWMRYGRFEGRQGVGVTPTATLSLRYAGSTTTALTSDEILEGNGQSSNPNLTNQAASSTANSINLNDAAESTAYIHYFDIGITFTKGDFNSAFRTALFNVNISNGLSLVAPDGTPGGTTDKYFAFGLNASNASLFFVNADGFTAGDLQGIVLANTSASAAYAAQVGIGGGTINGVTSTAPTYVARIAIRTNGPLASNQTIAITPGAGQNFGFYTAASGSTGIQAVGLTGSSFTLTAGAP